ncbi:MAG: AraC family transcriptional regulator [Clostridia bacterium]|nr:AraC family transcriptional regulator [Clostridia bacterium]
MKMLLFSDLLTEDINAVEIQAVERFWKDGNVNRYPDGRKENILSYTIDGKKSITGKNSQVSHELNPPVIIFIPADTPYESHTIADGTGGGHTICFKFKLLDQFGEEVRLTGDFRIWEGDHSDKLLQRFKELLNAYLEPNPSPILLKSILFEILFSLSNRHTKLNIPARYRRLLPAIRYIEKNLDKNISTETLAQMCFMSESYFRVCFRNYIGSSPVNYRNRLRVEKASELLRSPLWTLPQIIETLGFYDSAHFRKMYKKYYGYSPTEQRS